jgi:hypothetical protein
MLLHRLRGEVSRLLLALPFFARKGHPFPNDFPTDLLSFHLVSASSQRLAITLDWAGVYEDQPKRDQSAGTAQEVHEPIKGRCESFNRVLPPRDESHVVLAARNAACFCGCDTRITASMQLKEDFRTIAARHDHSM